MCGGLFLIGLPYHERTGIRGTIQLQARLRAYFGDRVEASIARYARLQADPEQWCARHPISQLTIDDAETMAISIANELEEHLAGEFAFTAKRPLGDSWYAYARRCADALGVPALAKALDDAASVQRPDGFDLRRAQTGSYRHIDGQLVPMTHPHLARWNFGEGAGATFQLYPDVMRPTSVSLLRSDPPSPSALSALVGRASHCVALPTNARSALRGKVARSAQALRDGWGAPPQPTRPTLSAIRSST